MEMSGQLHGPAALPPGKESPVPIGQEAGWVTELQWRREKFPASAGTRTPDHAGRSPIPAPRGEWWD